MLFKISLLVGFFFLVHAAFSAAQYRSYLRVTEQNFTATSLPLDIILQAFVSLLIILYSIVEVSGSFQVIYADDDLSRKRQDLVFGSQSSFATFNHRGKILISSIRQAEKPSIKN